jgi:hypothetical protein
MGLRNLGIKKLMIRNEKVADTRHACLPAGRDTVTFFYRREGNGY